MFFGGIFMVGRIPYFAVRNLRKPAILVWNSFVDFGISEHLRIDNIIGSE